MSTKPRELSDGPPYTLHQTKGAETLINLQFFIIATALLSYLLFADVRQQTAGAEKETEKQCRIQAAGVRPEEIARSPPRAQRHQV